MKDEAQQYEWLLTNRRREGPRGLDELSPRARRRRDAGGPACSPLAAAVARAGRALRRRELATAAWERVASPAWLPETAVQAVVGRALDTAVIAASSTTLCFDLRRRADELTRRVRAQVPGVRHLCFVVAGVPVADEEHPPAT